MVNVKDVSNSLIFDVQDNKVEEFFDSYECPSNLLIVDDNYVEDFDDFSDLIKVR